MDFIDSEIEKYALSYSSKESDLLYELNRQTHIKILQPRMLSGHLQGRFLSMISKALSPDSILESDYIVNVSDSQDSSLDLNEYLIKHPSATFYIYAKGHSMNDIGIYDGDVMIVDRALEAKSKDIIIAVINGEFTVKRIYIKNNSIYLIPENKTFKSILIEDDMDFQIW